MTSIHELLQRAVLQCLVFTLLREFLSQYWQDGGGHLFGVQSGQMEVFMHQFKRKLNAIQ